MSDKSGNRVYFENTTVALGTLYTIFLLAVIGYFLIFG